MAITIEPSEQRRRRFILIATIIGSSMAFVDGSVVNIALPTIGRDLHAGLGAQQWIMLSYSLAVASLYIVSGSLGDRFGRWRLFVAGVAGFAAASALAAIAPNTALLVSARVLQGVAGALLTTNSLALLRATYAEDSGRAVGQWTAWSGIGTMIGPPAGGLLVEYASWRWIFFINLPAALLALAAAWAGRGDEHRPAVPRPLQPVGAIAIALAFGALTYALIEGPQTGFASVLWAFALALAGLVLFVASERRSANPVLPMDLLASRVFQAANLYTLLVYAALGGAGFYLALYLQSGAVGYSPARASLVFLPISLVMFFLAARFGRLADRDGPRRYLAVAPLVMAVGFVLLTLVTDHQPVGAAAGRAGAVAGPGDAGGADHGHRAEGRAGRVRRAGGGREHDRLPAGRADRNAGDGRRDHAGVRRVDRASQRRSVRQAPQPRPAGRGHLGLPGSDRIDRRPLPGGGGGRGSVDPRPRGRQASGPGRRLRA